MIILDTNVLSELMRPAPNPTAHPHAQIASQGRRMGRSISQFDAQIAAIAHSSGAAVATPNVTDFEPCGVNLINPWD